MTETKCVSPRGKPTGTGSEGAPWNVAAGVTRMAPGDTLLFLEGEYPNERAHRINAEENPELKSGTAGKPIRYASGPNVTLQAGIHLPGVSNLEIGSLRVRTDGKRWLSDTQEAPAKNLALAGLSFDNDSDRGGAGILLHGRGLRLSDCVFQRWWPGDMCRFSGCVDLQLVGMDFSGAEAGHSLLSLEDCGFVFVDMCNLTNPWARALLAIWTTGTKGGRRVCIQRSSFEGVDFEGGADNPYNDTDGDGQAVRFSLVDSVFRWNQILDTNKGTATESDGNLQMLLYNEKQKATGLRIYHNTWRRNQNSAIALSRNISASSFDIRDGRIFNNVVDGQEAQALYVAKKELTAEFLESWRFMRNVCPESIYLKGVMPGPSTIGFVESRWPGIFKDNITLRPKFRGGAGDGWSANLLAEGSPGYQQAYPMARITGPGEGLGRFIQVDDTKVFFTDKELPGRGDRILVGGKEARIMDKDGDTLALDVAVKWKTAKPVFHVQSGGRPSCGAPWRQ